MFTKYIFFAFISLISNCYALDCGIINNDVDKCVCYVREETRLYNNMGCYDMGAIKIIVKEVCNGISYCQDAYANNDDSCPKAIWSSYTSSCRNACLIEITREYRKKFIGDMCIQDIPNDFSTCSEGNSSKDEDNIVYECGDGWKM